MRARFRYGWTLRRRTRFTLALAVLGLVAALEGWGIYHWRQRGQAARSRLQQVQGEIARLEQTRPAPTRQTAEAIASELEAIRGEVATKESAFATRSTNASATPVGRAEAYFEIAALVEEYRARSGERGVALGSEAMHFGFSAYAKEGPEPAMIDRVRRQQQIARVVVDALLEAGPKAILSVRREPARGRGGQSGRSENADYYSPDPRWSVVASGLIETTGMRVIFTGYTSTLRAFLNRLAGSSVLVRTVEVDQAGEDGEATRKESMLPTLSSVVLRESTRDEPPELTRPIVRRQLSTFTVTVEYAELESTLTTTKAVPAITPEWRPPRAQSRGDGWVFDLFTPPEIFFDAGCNEFSIAPPPGEAVPWRDPFGLTLVSVRREPFRLQLVGEVGVGGKRRGIFEHRQTGEVFLAARGQEIPGHRVDIASLEERPVSHDDERWPSRLAARIQDAASGREIDLVAGEEGGTGALIATVESDPGGQRTVGVGEAFEAGASRYRIEAITEQPATITVIKESATLAAPERRVLEKQEGGK